MNGFPPYLFEITSPTSQSRNKTPHPGDLTHPSTRVQAEIDGFLPFIAASRKSPRQAR